MACGKPTSNPVSYMLIRTHEASSDKPLLKATMRKLQPLLRIEPHPQR